MEADAVSLREGGQIQFHDYRDYRDLRWQRNQCHF